MSELQAPQPTEPDDPRPGGPRLRVELTGRTIWQTIGAILATLALLWAMNAARTIIAQVAIAFFFSLAMEPAVRRMHERRGWRRGAAVGVIFGAAIALLVGFVFVLVPAVKILADTIAASASEWVATINDFTSEYLGLPLDTEAVAGGVADAGSATGEWAADPFGTILGFASSTVSLLFSMATIALFTFYFSADAPRIKEATLRRFSPRTQERIDWTWDQAIVQTGGYFYSRSILMAINGTGFFVTMALVGLPIELAIALALFGGFVSVFIPAVGTYIGAAVPIAVTLALQGLVPALVLLGYALVYQQIENYWLSPKISSDTMSLSGGVAFGAALAGGAIAGPMGAFVALPVAALLTSTLSAYTRSYELVGRQARDDPTASAPPDAAEQTERDLTERDLTERDLTERDLTVRPTEP
jgi:predicted PurR-regulated permease PerM